jgi:uncharacterized protein (TIGR03437 family)
MSFKHERIRASLWALAAGIAPVALYGFAGGPVPQRTGAPVDGGLNCSACHRTFGAANTGSGRVVITAVSYTPGQKQNITVTIEDPDAERWGFQLTARTRNDETKAAGTFTPVPDQIRVLCQDPNDTGCGGRGEFAEHTAASTQQGTRNRGTFTVEWTPPAQDVGEIIFYAAGNAANGNGTNVGDHIYTTSLVIRPVCNLTQRPTIAGIREAAAGRTAITSGGMISVFGAGFSSSDHLFAAASSDLVNGRLAPEFGCVALEVAGRRAPVFHIVKTQLNAQAPQIDVSGPVEVRVILNPGAPNELRSDAATVTAQAFSPAFFFHPAGTGHVAARNASANNVIVGADAPAKPGDVVTLYGTGFGATNPALETGEFAAVASPLTTPVTVTIGDVTLDASDILYAGAAGDAPGFYQFNLRLPSTLPDGNAPVKVRIGGFETQDGAVIAVRR